MPAMECMQPETLIRTLLMRMACSACALHPTSASWVNLVVRWFAELTNRKLRRSTYRSVAELEADIRAWIKAWHDELSPPSGPRLPVRSLRPSPPTANELH